MNVVGFIGHFIAVGAVGVIGVGIATKATFAVIMAAVVILHSHRIRVSSGVIDELSLRFESKVVAGFHRFE